MVCTRLLQVLNSLAPLSAAKQDSDGAQQMLKAAFTLVKSLGDTSSLLTTILGLEKLHAQLEDTGRSSLCTSWHFGHPGRL